MVLQSLEKPNPQLWTLLGRRPPGGTRRRPRFLSCWGCSWDFGLQVSASWDFFAGLCRLGRMFQHPQTLELSGKVREISGIYIYNVFGPPRKGFLPVAGTMHIMKPQKAPLQAGASLAQ